MWVLPVSPHPPDQGRGSLKSSYHIIGHVGTDEIVLIIVCLWVISLGSFECFVRGATLPGGKKIAFDSCAAWLSQEARICSCAVNE